MKIVRTALALRAQERKRRVAALLLAHYILKGRSPRARPLCQFLDAPCELGI